MTLSPASIEALINGIADAVAKRPVHLDGKAIADNTLGHIGNQMAGTF